MLRLCPAHGRSAQVDVASDDDSDLEIEFESFEC